MYELVLEFGQKALTYLVEIFMQGGTVTRSDIFYSIYTYFSTYEAVKLIEKSIIIRYSFFMMMMLLLQRTWLE